MANQQDASFVNQLGPANVAEITEGNLAIQRSPELAVSEFGRWMVTDHTALGSIFALVAKYAAGLTVPTQPTAAQQAEINALSKLSGQSFDKAYLANQVTDHQQVVALLNQEVAKGQNPGLVSFAKEALPIIQAHLQEAQILSSDLIPGSRSIGPQASHQSNSSVSFSESQASPPSFSMMHQETYSQSTGMVQVHQSTSTS
jgi:putative membrane protein